MNETHATPVNGTLSTNDKQATFQQHNSNINLARTLLVGRQQGHPVQCKVSHQKSTKVLRP